MITQLELTNFGPLAKVEWKKLGNINLVIGGNGCGKTFLLKALYSAMRTMEEYKRGDAPRGAMEILAERLHWTFQAVKIGDLVSKGGEGHLNLRCWVDGNEFCYSFGRDTTKHLFFGESSPAKKQQLNLSASQGSVVPAQHHSGVAGERHALWLR